jgi:hypothetical protein
MCRFSRLMIVILSVCLTASSAFAARSKSRKKTHPRAKSTAPQPTPQAAPRGDTPRAEVPAKADVRVKTATPRQARVVYVTSGSGYIDRGAAHGLRVGAQLTLRGGKSHCTVTAVADMWARCDGVGLKAYDIVGIDESDVTTSPSGTAVRAVVASASERDEAITTITTAPFDLVGYNGPPATSVRRMSGSVTFAHDLWAQQDLSNRGFQRERVDLALDARNLGIAGLSVHARATAMHWTSRPSNARFRPNADDQLYVWQTELDYRPLTSGIAVAAGRLRPWSLPGIAVLDGAQVAAVNPRSGVEAGVYGGGVPDTITLQPRTTAWALGGYATRDFRFSKTTVLAATLRVGVLQTAHGGLVATLGSEVMAQLGRRASMTGMLIADADTKAFGSGRIDLWSTQLEVRPSDALALFAQVRGEAHSYYALAEGTEHDWQKRLHTDAAATWTATRFVTLTAIGGTTTDVGFARGYIGPELRLQRILPLEGAAAFGYFKEIGAYAAHTVYAQVGVRPASRLSLWTRGSYSFSNDLDMRNEAALSLAANGAFTTWLSAGASLMSTLGNLDGRGTTAVGLVGRIYASGHF